MTAEVGWYFKPRIPPKFQKHTPNTFPFPEEGFYVYFVYFKKEVY
jgi:hypothetical protein